MYNYNCKRIKGNWDSTINCQSEMSVIHFYYNGDNDITVYLSCCADKQNNNYVFFALKLNYINWQQQCFCEQWSQRWGWLLQHH